MWPHVTQVKFCGPGTTCATLEATDDHPDLGTLQARRLGETRTTSCAAAPVQFCCSARLAREIVVAARSSPPAAPAAIKRRVRLPRYPWVIAWTGGRSRETTIRAPRGRQQTSYNHGIDVTDSERSRTMFAGHLLHQLGIKLVAVARVDVAETRTCALSSLSKTTAPAGSRTRVKFAIDKCYAKRDGGTSRC